MKQSNIIIKNILLITFFLSGFSALIYQIVWIKMFGQVFGLTIFAVSTVLTAFMAGLALGSYIFGKLIDAIDDPLLVFCFLETGIGIFAFLFPFLFKMMSGVYVTIAHLIHPDLYLNNLTRFFLSFLLLLIPTTMMGGTLPVLSKYFIRRQTTLGSDIGNLYSINNLGAVGGCFLSSFVLIRAIGLTGNIYIAAVFNILIAIIVFFIRSISSKIPTDDHEKLSERTQKKTSQKSYPPMILRLVLWVFAIEGFTTLSYEVIWTRILLGISTDRSVYFYSTVIIAFIFGLSIGSFIIARFIDKKKNLVHILGIIEITIGIISCLLLTSFSFVSDLFSKLRPAYTDPWIFSLGIEYLVFFLMMLSPVILMGMTFPIVAKVYAMNIKTVGNSLGVIGSLDTIGSIFGSFAAGFILIPFFGVIVSVLITASINVLIGITLILLNPDTKRNTKLGFAVITAAGVFSIALVLPHENYFKVWQTRQEGDRLLFYKEGLGSTVAVPQKLEGVKELAIDGAVTAIAEYGDIRVHKLLAYLPYLFCDQPRSALIVGFGMGVTAQSLIQDEMENVTCVEICPEIVEGSSRYFSRENKNVLEEVKLKIVIEDGRSYMATSDNRYDIITTNAIHQRLSINIYTKEFYQLCKARMTDSGVMCQWIATNWISELEYKMLLKSFVDVFPNTSVWVSNIGHVLLLGTPSPLLADIRVLSRKMSQTKTMHDLKEVHLDDPIALLALYACGADEITRYLDNTPATTDDRPFPEFSTHIATLPTLSITDSILSYTRDPLRFVSNSATSEEIAKLRNYSKAEISFLKARYGFFDGSTESQTIASYLEEAVKLNPYNYSYFHTLGDTFSEMGEFDQAEIAYRKEVALSPNNPIGRINLAYALLKLERFEEVLSEINVVLSIEPENGIAHYLRSIVYRLKAQFEQAIVELKYVTDHYPSYSSAKMELGEVYFALGKYTDAKKTVLEYLKEKKDDLSAQQMLDELRKQGY